MDTTSTDKPLRLVAAATEVENFFASGEKLYQKHRAKMLEDEQAYQRARFDLEDQIRELDARFGKTRADGLRMLEALAALREG